jgi:DNA topoisomerase-1
MKDYIVRTIKRKKKDMYTYEYRNKADRLVSQKVFTECLKGLYLPPALDKVQINRNKKDKVLAIGYDTKDRPQYTYNKKFTEKQSKNKFHHMITFGESYKKILKQIQQDLYTEADTKNKQVATILRFVIDCSFRVGNEKYTKENKSYGVTTLESRHVTIKGPLITVEFIGKKGVKNKCSLRNKRLSKTLRQKKKTIRKNDRLFTYRKGSKYYEVRPNDVNSYLKKFGDFSTKNFRTWSANLELIHQIQKVPDLSPKDSDAKKTKVLNECIDKVAFKLHNTRAVCKSNYLDPKVMESFLNDTQKFLAMFRSCESKEDYTDKYIQFLK